MTRNIARFALLVVVVVAAFSGRCAKVGALVHQVPPPSNEPASAEVGLAA